MTEEPTHPAVDIDDLPEAEITASDIVFDCPNCGHNLVVDYRAAGLQVPCVACGKTIVAPIPDGLHIEDLDRDPGEILQQLLQTRRILMQAESENRTLREALDERDEIINAQMSAFEQIEMRIAALQENADLMNRTRHDIAGIISNLPKIEEA